jgi:peptidoglycan/xylan/chitin deacetylase (PgdA/CDA1 family)
MYHRVATLGSDRWGLSVRPENFAEQLQVLKERFTVLSAKELSSRLKAGNLPRRGIVLTFDDGYADNLLAAKPLLAASGLPATLFLASGAVDAEREFWWDELECLLDHEEALPDVLTLTIQGRNERFRRKPRGKTDCPVGCWIVENTEGDLYVHLWRRLRSLAAAEQEMLLSGLASEIGIKRVARPDYRTLTRVEASELMRGGLFELGAHTVSHPALSVHPSTFQNTEICESKREIEHQFDLPVTHFAYPYGDYSPETVRLLTANGFLGAFTTNRSLVTAEANPWELPRYQVRDWNGDRFDEELSKIFS